MISMQVIHHIYVRMRIKVIHVIHVRMRIKMIDVTHDKDLHACEP